MRIAIGVGFVCLATLAVGCSPPAGPACTLNSRLFEVGSTYTISFEREIPPEGFSANPNFCKTITFPPKLSAKVTQIHSCALTAEFDFDALGNSCSDQFQSCAVTSGDCPSTLTLGYVELWSPDGADFPLEVKVRTRIDPGSCQQTCGVMCWSDPNGCAPVYAGTIAPQ